MKLINRDNGNVLAIEVREAATFFTRLKGLLFTERFPPGTALHIRPCSSVHTFFMKYPIDVLHLDRHQRVVGTEEELQPGKLGRKYTHTVSVIELPFGTLKQTQTEIGQTVQLITH